ncbi:helix-turn-helix transcriptional regulator [Rhodococcus ruber]|uniref:helix-turn-helix transcriptional regulator n=1 Tax=Rhodococcus ruber TaxID=1830 RepID=UPI00378427EF
MTHPRWATKQEAAAHLGVSLRTIDRFIAEGKLTAYRHGQRMTRLDLNDVDALLTPAA